MLDGLLPLVVGGLLGGFVAGLAGVGGGIVFAPFLFFYYQSVGVAPEFVTQLTIGSSLFCTLTTSIASSWHHYRRASVIPRIALWTGLAGGLAVILSTLLVTTRSWYDQSAFQVVFSVVLMYVAARMILAARDSSDHDGTDTRLDFSGGALAATGSVAGVVSSAAGVGGGVVLVPAYNRFLLLPIHRAVGTSSATIVIISLFGVAMYAALGMDTRLTSTSLGFVDPVRALLLAVPAAFTTRLGVQTAHRLNRRNLQIFFALFAVLVAIRLIVRALG